MYIIILLLKLITRSAGLRRLLGTFGYEGACANGNKSCIAAAAGEPASADQRRGVVSFSFFYYLRLALVPCRESVGQRHAGVAAVPVARYFVSAPPPWRTRPY